MALRKQSASARPRLACEITLDRVIVARASEQMPRLDAYTSRKLAPGVIAPGLNGQNVVDGQALRAAISGGLASVAGKSRDVIVIVPDAAVRVLLLDFDSLPSNPQESEPVIRFRMKKSLPFDVDQAAISYEVRRSNGNVHAVAAVSPRSIVDEYEAAFRDAGYTPSVVVPSALAALGLVEGDRPTLMVKVDPLNITIIAAEHQELRLVRTLENPRGTNVTAAELAEAVLPSLVFFEDTFAAHVEQIYVGGIVPTRELAPLLEQQTHAKVVELAPQLSSEQNISGETVPPSMMAGIVGALLG
jgi:type IV pilus assembly protein PilM